MTGLNGWKTAIGMVLVIVGQLCALLGAKWPVLTTASTALIDIGSGIGLVGITHKVVKQQQVAE